MDVKIAAKKTIVAVLGEETPKVYRDNLGKTPDHALWMLQGIVSGYIQHEKAHRWLGYAQGILVVHGNITLADAKSINKLA